MHRQIWFRWVLMFALCGALGWGCRSPKGAGSDNLAAIEIKGFTSLETARAVSEVFHQAGYTTVPVAANKEQDLKLLFDKPGSKGASILYGDWAGGVWYRARVRITTAGADTLLVTCNAYRVLDHGSAHFEEEQKLSHMAKGTYQDLLNKVPHQLRAASNP